MIIKEVLAQVISRQKENLLSAESGIIRFNLKSIQPYKGLVLVITGMRRSGKSTLLKQLAKNLKNFNYINFEDHRLLEFELSDFQRLDDVFASYGECDYYLLDEVQNVIGWERYVRTLQEEGKSIIVTGSNAKLLSKELATLLTGRHLRYELFPFSYNEYLLFKNKPNSVDAFTGYMTTGGLPEFLRLGEETLLQQLFEDVVIKDVAVRHKIRHINSLKKLGQLLISNIGKTFSYNSLRKTLEIKNTTTVSTYMSFLEDAYLFFRVPFFSFSQKQQMINPQKIYSVDTGLVNANTLSFSEDSGRLLENMVFLHFRRLTNNIFYYKKTHECDFVVNITKDKHEAYQVCYNINPDNQKREINGLIEAMNELSLDFGTIVTFAQNDLIQIDGKTIRIVAANDFFTENSI
jgi:uncharacterized protein